MDKLPSDIMLDILSRLPYETIINCKLVIKPWRDITSGIKLGFIFQFGESGFKLRYDDITMQGYNKTRMEIDNHPCIEPDDIVGSCNGLVCLSVGAKYSLAHDTIYISNPITEEYVYLPKFKIKMGGYFLCGFGYLHSIGKYKVVRIYYEHNEENQRVEGHGQVQVYTLGSGHGWRDIGRTNHYLDNKPGVCANGALHWTVNSRKKIVALDLQCRS